jgi:c-di-GMP-binding flagellar brake protein YcgR
MDKELKLNNRLEVIYKGVNYKSNVQDTDGNVIALSVPYKSNYYVIPEIGEKIEIIYYGNDDKVYKFHSKILGKKSIGIPVLLVEKPKLLEKIQRRNYVRINFLNSIDYCFVDDDLDFNKINDMSEIKYFFRKGKLLDISGGGMRISIKEAANIGDRLLIKIEFPPKEFYIGCRVVRRDKDLGDTFNLGIQYEKINGSERETIIRFIFKRMQTLK